ncbi:hypothetical protein C0995_007077 [Termitomyces sp. Mi166|nr:hypothetical protein C0995_007077 [Termitomyces sp. Mi166\
MEVLSTSSPTKHKAQVSQDLIGCPPTTLSLKKKKTAPVSLDNSIICNMEGLSAVEPGLSLSSHPVRNHIMTSKALASAESMSSSPKKKSTVTHVYPSKSGVEVKIEQDDSPLLVPKAQSSPIKISDSDKELPSVLRFGNYVPSKVVVLLKDSTDNLNSFVNVEAECNDAELSCSNEVDDDTLSNFIVDADDDDSYKALIVDNNRIDDPEKPFHIQPFICDKQFYDGTINYARISRIAKIMSKKNWTYRMIIPLSKKTTSKALKNKSLFTPVEQPKPLVLHVVKAHSYLTLNILFVIVLHDPTYVIGIVEPGNVASLLIPAKTSKGKGKAKVAKSII